jgi:hypothetical protein
VGTGANTPSYCVEFGGTPIKDTEASMPGKIGLYIAKGAAVPAACAVR